MLSSDTIDNTRTWKYCFSCHEVLGLELVGDKVIRTLLDIFVPVLTDKNKEQELSDPTSIDVICS